MTVIGTLLVGAAMALCATSAQATNYIKYEVLTSGSGEASSRFGTRSVQNMGFTFVVDLDGPASRPLSGGNGVEFNSSAFLLGLKPGGASASYSSNALTLTDISTDHNFTANICAPASVTFTSLATQSFGTSGCSFSFDATIYRGEVYSYRGEVVELRSSTFEGTSIPAGLTALSAAPEPTTWALMLSGFALTGYALRRRSYKVAFAAK